MRVAVNLGILSPGNDRLAKSELAATEALAEQAVADVIFLGESGYDVSAPLMRLNALRDQLVALRAATATIDDEDFSAWQAQHAAVDTELRMFLDDVVRLRRKSSEYAQFRGLAWGLGSAVAVAGAGYFVWRRRGRRRRR